MPSRPKCLGLVRGDLEAKVAFRGRCARELVQGYLAEGRVREDLGPNPAASTLVMATHPGTAGRPSWKKHTDDGNHCEAAVHLPNGRLALLLGRIQEHAADELQAVLEEVVQEHAADEFQAVLEEGVVQDVGQVARRT